MSGRAPEEEQPSPLIVGIGASAGGLAVLEELFSNVPSDCGLAFVVVQHLAPQHASRLGQLLGRRTTMPVVEAQNEVAVEANHVYVIAPGTTLGISGGFFRVVSVDGERRGLIDTFLRAEWWSTSSMPRRTDRSPRAGQRAPGSPSIRRGRSVAPAANR